MNSINIIFLVLLVLLVQVASFSAPSISKTKQRQIDLNMVIKINLPEDLAGNVPLSDKGYFDPLGLSNGVSPTEIKRWREAELKHGRLAMVREVRFN